jgi:hypothetical protein
MAVTDSSVTCVADPDDFCPDPTFKNVQIPAYINIVAAFSDKKIGLHKNGL